MTTQILQPPRSLPKNFSKFAEEIQEIQDTHSLPDYHAFIYWFIETNYGFETSQILNSLCDGCHDKGIDAVVISPNERTVTVIQSKFEREGNLMQVKDSEVELLGAVKSYFKSRAALAAATTKANAATKRLVNEAFDAYHGSPRYSLELIFITTHKEAPQTQELIQRTLGFRGSEFQIFDYSRIMGLVADKARDFTPRLGVYSLPYIDADGTLVRKLDNKAWVLTVPAEEIRRMVVQYGDQLFRKNVRNFLDKNVCNDGILTTLGRKPDNFWYYNNGISIICDDADLNVENKYIRIINPQIVNGCQTARSIEKFDGELKADVLVRVIASGNHSFIDEITHFQNSSNPVKKRDFKSNDPIQIRLKRDLKRRGYYYEIKRGEEFKKLAKKYRAMKQSYPHEQINNEDVAKLLVAVNGNAKMGPALATSKGSETFFDDEYYPTIFNESLSAFNILAPTLLSNMIYWTYGGGKRFFKFDQAWKFKGRALYYVLRFIYDALSKKTWEKGFVEFYESARQKHWEGAYDKVWKVFKSIVDEYFVICYKSWNDANRKTHVEYNAYIQSPETLKDLERKHRTELSKLEKRVVILFNRFLLST
jgi:hypothetical protein